MLDITGNDIMDLSDSDLRSLVGLLCEAELNCSSLPTAGVTWGGHQNAPDGGIDVRVEVTKAPHSDSFIPRAKTAFQVKKPDMPRSAIINEMKPKGELREVIIDLVDSNGAYIIVSSQGSTADSSLQDRVSAMRDALSELPNASNIKVDFYDRERVAGWVRSHPAIALWIREKLGRPIQGWRPYGNWANCPEGNESEYLSDDDIRFHNSSTSSAEGMSGIDGIQAIRKSLHQPASSVRLTGLSGVGKTRLLQALFDERVGKNPLNKLQIFYTDISDSPIPAPRHFAEQLITLRKPTILAIDNCPPDLHRCLTSVCAASGSLVSLITVEYDVREDQPEETEVFRLEPASIGLIEKVIKARFSYVNQIAARTIAEFSGGNARIAIALANTIKQGENLSNLKDNALFDRLFHQRNKPNRELLKAAEVCSLVYSFECKTDDGEDLELQLLSSLADMSVRQIYEHISELKRRELIQQRSVWRAVLPHAIANKLAQRALENIPLNELHRVFEKSGSERVLKSFSRRLGYLHESDKAREIARKWLSEGGLLSDLSNLNKLGIDLFKNISPIEPETAIVSIEKAVRLDSSGKFLSRENANYVDFTRLLRSLAYDEVLFTRSANLLCNFALSENPKENSSSIRSILKSLFYIYLSGTHATDEQRLSVISELMKSGNEERIELAIELLDAALESWRFSSSHGFEFGAHSRDHGFCPKNNGEIKHWFKLFIEFTVDHATSESIFAIPAKSLLAKKFRGLWIKAGMFDELEDAAKRIITKGTWREGWVAVKSTLRFDSCNMEPELVSRLNSLAALIAPTTLIERARLYVLPGRGNALDLVDTIKDEAPSDSYHRLEKTTRSLGREVVNNESVLLELLHELLSVNGARLYSFGQGLADGCTQPTVLWSTFKQKISLIDSDHRNYQLLLGFLNGISSKCSDVVNKLLDDAVTDIVFGKAFPILQSSVSIDNKAVERLKLSLECDIAPIWQYVNLAYGRAHEAIPDDDLCEILRLISSKHDGENVAIEILQMRLHRNSDEEINVSSAISALGQELLLSYKLSRETYRSSHIDYGLGNIVELCFVNDSAANSAKELCKKLAKAFANYDIYSMDYGHVLEALSAKQPRAFLDGFLGDEIELNHRIDRAFSEDIENHSNPLSKIDDDLIVEWCETNPIVRYPLVAAVIEPYQVGDSDNGLEWTPIAQKIIVNSSDPIVILNKFKAAFRPMSWSGSRADIMQKRLCLITDLKSHENSLVAEWAAREEVEFKNEILSERKWESERDSSRDERFE